MTPYTRPSIAPQVFVDAAGQVIDYGNRWGGSPPTEAYSVTVHPERYAPLHTVAAALIDHLRLTYDVEIDDGPHVVADLLAPPSCEVPRAVRVRPREPDCAGLTFVFTAFPGLLLHAGLLHDFPFPLCGCDACDTPWQREADELEEHVFAVVSGNYSESVGRRDAEAAAWYQVRYPTGSSGGSSNTVAVPAERRAAAEPILRSLPSGWRAWPRRAGAE